jgi:RimJ/RimL family protein N-acetyltransferase
MHLRGRQVVLRAVVPTDAEVIFAACHGADMALHIPHFPDPYTEEDARRFTQRAVERWERESYTLAITTARSEEFLGVIEIGAPVEGAASIGYWVKRETRGRGVATEALMLVSRWAIAELGVERVWLTTSPDNVASQRVAEKAGFTREAVLRSHLSFRDGRRDSVVFSLLPGDFE